MTGNHMYNREGYFFSETRVIINEFYEFESSILPSAPHHLDREIIVKQGAKVVGDICGGMVYIGRNVEVLGSIICDNARISSTARIEGGIYTRFSIELEPDVHVGKDIFGNIVEIGDRVTVEGHVLGNEKVMIGESCEVSGMVFSMGELEIGDYSKLRDALSEGDMTIGSMVEIMDSTIWSREGTVNYGKGSLLEDEGRPTKIENAVRAKRSEGMEYTCLLPGGYYYIHSIDGELNDTYEEKKDRIKGRLEDLPGTELPLPHRNWKARRIVNSMDFESLMSVLSDVRAYKIMPPITRELKRLIQELSEYMQSVLETGRNRS